MGKNKKDKLVKVVAPQHVSATEPLVISFARWTADDLPKTVTVEIVEVDKSGSDDSLTTAEDLIVRYSGTLTPATEDSAQLENIKKLSVTSVARGPDRVWLRFANQGASDVVEAGIPFSPAIAANKANKIKEQAAEFAANEGSFYELAARIREGEGEDGAEIIMSDATAVRQRAFVLLAVEPLSQNDSSMTHDAGVRILETFHPNDKKRHQPRNWGSTVIRLRDNQPMELGSSGCSYVITTMLLRYLRVDAPPPKPDEGVEELDPADPVANQTVRLFDLHVDFHELAKKPQFKPRALKDAWNPDSEIAGEICKSRHAREKTGFIEHFMDKAAQRGLEPNELKAHKKALEASFDKETKGKDQLLLDRNSAEENIDEAPYYDDASITAESYVPLLIWRINELDGRAESYKLRRYYLNQYELSLTGDSDYRNLKHGEHERWRPQYQEIPLMDGQTRLKLHEHMVAGMQGISVSNSQAILIPLAPALKQLFGLSDTAPHKEIQNYTDDEPGDPELLPWQRYFVRTLDRGLPVIGLFSPGQYSSREDGGHFCMIVGYRYRTDIGDGSKKKVRFILNDPAGGRTFQYEAHDEEELNPEGADPTSQLKEPSTKGMERERRGLNLIIERRKLLSIREVRVYEPVSQGTSTWDTSRHARFLFFRGKVDDDAAQ